MSVGELEEDVAIEFLSMETTVKELQALRRDVAQREPAAREVAAAGLFLANFYSGVEGILKRLARYHRVPVPSGERWHVRLARCFCEPPRRGLPCLLDNQLATDLAAYRRFRHVVYHGYGFRLRWDDLLPGIERAADVLARFRGRSRAT